MNSGNVALKIKDVLPDHAWKRDSGKAAMCCRLLRTEPKLGPLSTGQEQADIGKSIVDKASKSKREPITQKEKEEWLSRLMEKVPDNGC